MIKIFYIVFLFSEAFAALYSAQDIVGQGNTKQKNKSQLNSDSIGADEPIPQPNKSGPTDDLIALVLPQNLYRIDLYFEEQNDTEVLEGTKNQSQESQRMEIVVQEVFELQPNTSYLMDDPEFKINQKIATPGIVSTTQSTILRTSPINSAIIEINITTNETKPHKSFLEKIEQGLGISNGGSVHTVFASVTMVLLSSIFRNVLIEINFI